MAIRVEDHLGIVYRLADRYIALGAPENEREDLVGEGSVALCEAADAFDAEGKAWPNFAHQRVARAMSRYLKKQREQDEILLMIEANLEDGWPYADDDAA